MIAHVVLFSPKDDIESSRRLAFAQSVVDICASISSVQRASVGRRVAIDPGYPRSFGDTTYEYAAVLEFETRDALVAYLNNPKHAELGKLFWEYCGRTVITEVEWVDLREPDASSKLAI